MHTGLEEYERTIQLPVDVAGRGVSFFEAEGLGTGGLRRVEEMKRECAGCNSPPCCGRNAELSPATTPIINRQNKGQNVADWDKLFQLESELQCIGEEAGAFLPGLGRSSVLETSVGSVEDTLELGEALQMLECRLNSIAAECCGVGKERPFLSREAVQKATECSSALTAYRGIAAAAESMTKFVTGIFNCKAFLPSKTCALKRAEEVSMLLDDMEKLMDSLETGVDTLREVSEAKLDALKRGLDLLSE
ncbi:uncharacterized protein Tco025E_07219 [Trypanosoma conorhini]|uniref:Uncharacterized protein n=1 Tax=Trypanosoma conorhini TaxID=83891 RepID=A0A3R7KR53_9TRYP|nr:uncharacterized protein Tco025E_07219 [Trypanosoma conorhini]RNF08101.1 hypothetical protein Tco025E_07219 [Trypanosoma conorhini]